MSFPIVTAVAWQDETPSESNVVEQTVTETEYFAAQQKYIKEQLAFTQRRVEQMQAERDQISEELFELDVTSGSYDEIMRMLQAQRIELTIDLAGLNARQQAIVNLESQQNQAASSEDEKKLLAEIVKQMEKRANLIRAKQQTGTASATEKISAEIQLTEAKLKLAQAEKVEPEIKPIQHEGLLQVSIERIDKQARLDTIESLLTKYYRSRASIESLNQLESQFELELNRKFEIENQLRKLNFQKGVNSATFK